MGQENDNEQSTGPVDEKQPIFLKKREQRKPEIIRLYFGKGHTLEQVAKAIGISKSEAHREVDKIRAEVLCGLKKDLRLNRKILGYMVDLLAQIDQNTRIFWEKIEELERDEKVFRIKLNRAYELMKQDADAKIDNLSELMDASRAVNAIHERQQTYFNLLRHQTMTKLEVWDRFGLCDKEALDVTVVGEVDIQKKLQEARTAVMNILNLIKIEVKDQKEQDRIYLQFARTITETGIKELQPPQIRAIDNRPREGRPENQ